MGVRVPEITGLACALVTLILGRFRRGGELSSTAVELSSCSRSWTTSFSFPFMFEAVLRADTSRRTVGGSTRFLMTTGEAVEEEGEPVVAARRGEGLEGGTDEESSTATRVRFGGEGEGRGKAVLGVLPFIAATTPLPVPTALRATSLSHSTLLAPTAVTCVPAPSARSLTFPAALPVPPTAHPAGADLSRVTTDFAPLLTRSGTPPPLGLPRRASATCPSELSSSEEEESAVATGMEAWRAAELRERRPYVFVTRR